MRRAMYRLIRWSSLALLPLSLLTGVENGVAVVKLPALGPADVVVLEH